MTKEKMQQSEIQNDEKLSTIPNKSWEKFFAKFVEIESLPIADWTSTHLLGYFAQKYQEAYHCKYSWKFNNTAPSKSFEMWQIKTLAAKLSAKPEILKEYIDWAFLTLMPKAKRKLTSISFMTKDEVINDYKLKVLLPVMGNTQIDRSTQLPQNMISVLSQHNLSATTYGDLAFISKINPQPDNIQQAFHQLQQLGFQLDSLQKII